LLKKRAEDVPSSEVTMADSKGTRIQWLISSEDGAPHFAMRRFTIEPGGSIGLHNHAEEHELYVLSGRARIFSEVEEVTAQEGDVLYVAPDEPHGYENLENVPFVFICIVPLLGKK